MPDIVDWFPSPVTLPWEEMDYSFLDERKGPLFFTYPLWWLLPYVQLRREDLENSPSPLWIPDLHPSSSFGRSFPRSEGSYIIDLPSRFGEYLQSLQYKVRKKFRGILRRAEFLECRAGTQEDIDELWSHHVQRVQELNKREDAVPYTDDELGFRRELYRNPRALLLSFFLKGELIGINVSLPTDRVVLDLACLMKNSEEVARLSLGTVAILKNIELVMESGVRQYDLLTKSYGYKQEYGAKPHALRHYIRCSRRFARAYGLEECEVSEWCDE
jgi:hypothetical protein